MPIEKRERVSPRFSSREMVGWLGSPAPLSGARSQVSMGHELSSYVGFQFSLGGG